MNLPDLILELEREGIHLREDAGELRYRAPKGALTEEHRAALRERKPAILEYLRTREKAQEIQSQPASRYEPFPVTDIQAAYLLGRRESFAYGGVGCHGYGELVFPEIDLPRLNAAWRTIILRHDMLRAVVSEDGMQQILKDVPDYEIAVLDLRTANAERTAVELKKVRAGMDHRVYEPQKWPLFDLRITLKPDQAILHFSIDLLISDFVSTQILLEELYELLQNPEQSLPAVDVSFRDYVMATQHGRNREQYSRDREYWLKLLDSMPPPPELPLLERQAGKPPRFRRKQLLLASEKWAKLSANVGELGITPSTVVLAVFTETIARWCRHPRFTLNVTLQNRLPLHPHIDRVVGDFTAIELLAVDASPSKSFRDRARALQARLWEDLDHRSFTGTEVMRELSRRQREHSGLFPVVFTSSIGVAIGKGGGPPRGLGDLTHGITQTPQVWIDCQAMESRRGLIVNWDTRQEVFPRGLIDDMFSAFQDLLDRAVSDAEVWDQTDPVKLPPIQLERRRVANDTKAPLPQGLLQQGIVDQALRNPNRPAIITSRGSLSFGELLGKALAVADLIRADGAFPGDLIAVRLEKGHDQTVAVLGILLAGCAYVPLDNDQPPARRDQVVQNAGVKIALVHSSKAKDPDWPTGIRLVPISDLAPSPVPKSLPPRFAACEDPAYVIYTSGSTGVPKGVAISHTSAVNTITDINRRFGVGPSDRILGLSNLGFDLSVYDVFGVLAAGGCLVLPDDCRRADPSHWAELIVDHQVTVWNSVPALMQMLHDYLIGEGDAQQPLASLRLALLSGDWIPVRLPDQMRALLPGLSLVSLGGATEAAIWSIFHPIETVLSEWRSIPYGRPLTNQSFCVLDQELRPCADWVAGELYIGGAGLALGYWRDEALTAERFIIHSLSGERLYRTGDWGRYRNDGSIEFLGREDRQVKIRGYRIELGEVEGALCSNPAVGRAAAVVDGDNPWGQRLIAFVEPVINASNGFLADDTKLAEAAQGAGAEIIPDVGYDGYMAHLDEAALLSMTFALSEWGLFDQNESWTRIQSLLSPHHLRLVRRWIRALTETGLLSYSQETNRYLATRKVDRASVEEAWRQAEDDAKGKRESNLLDFFRISGLRLPELLAFEGDVSRIISAENQPRFLQAIYSEPLSSRWAKRVVSAVVQEIGSRTQRRLRVLELGAISPLSTTDIPGLAGRVDALITDSSGYLLEEARQRLGSQDCVQFAVFDISRPYRAQGLEPNSFDVIIATNTLHRAPNIEMAMRQAAELLSPSGWLIFTEATEDHYPIMMSLELMLKPDPVTGDFLDLRQGTDQTFLSADQWHELIRQVGGEIVLCALEDESWAGHSRMGVLAARFKSDRESIDTGELETFLAKRLPPYMAPSYVQVVDALPLTANAKIDYNLLRSWIPRQTSSLAVTAGEDSSNLERSLSESWSEMLNVRNISRDQSFLSLGGDSLIAARLAARLRESVAEAGNLFFDELLQEILKGVTIAELASTLMRAGEKKKADGVHLPGKRLPVALRKLGGMGEPIWVVVPDNGEEQGAVKRLTDLLSVHRKVFGLEVDDTEAYLNLPVESLIEHVASDCVATLIDDASLSIDVIGLGAGTALALEVARQMTEEGGIVGRLFVAGVPPSHAANECLSDTPVRCHSLKAIDAWEAVAYAGSVTLLLRSEDMEFRDDIASFWSGVCLGDLQIVELEQDDFGPILEGRHGHGGTDQTPLVFGKHV